MKNLEILFESKRQYIGGEKVYSARDIMKIFGYYKWERFLGAINRAISSHSEQIVSKNFFKKIDTQTGGRHREDYLLTLGGVYLLLQKCDNRKAEVSYMINYIQKLLKAKTDIKNQKKSKNNYLYLFFGFLFIVFFVLFFIFLENIISKYNSNLEFKKEDEIFLNTDFENSIGNLQKEDLKDSIQISQREEIIDENIIDNQSKYQLFKENINSYSDFFVGNKFNNRNNFTYSLQDEDLIKYMFLLGNENFFKESCSLFSKDICLRASKNLSSYANFFTKTISGIQNIEIKKSSIGKNRYCVSYEYNLKNDLNPQPIKETFLYILGEYNGFYQIEQRFCQKIIKGSKNIKCPYELKNYECLE